MRETMPSMTARPAAATGEDFQAWYRVLSYELAIRSEVPGAGELADDLLGSFKVPVAPANCATYEVRFSDAPGQGALEALLDGEPIWYRDTVEALMDYLMWHVNRQAIDRCHNFLLLHSAVASWEGGAVILPAGMDSGKTTLVAGLVRAGFSYLSDEVGVVEPDGGEVLPYPKPLWMERESIEAVTGLMEEIYARPGRLLAGRYHVRPTDLGSNPIGGPARARMIISPKYATGAETRATPLTRAEAILMLKENCFNFHSFGARGLEILREVVSGAACYRLEHGDLDAAVDVVRALLAGSEGAP